MHIELAQLNLSINCPIQRFDNENSKSRAPHVDSFLYSAGSKNWRTVAGGTHGELNSKSVVCGTVGIGSGPGPASKVVILATGRNTQDQVHIVVVESSCLCCCEFILRRQCSSLTRASNACKVRSIEQFALAQF